MTTDTASRIERIRTRFEQNVALDLDAGPDAYLAMLLLACCSAATNGTHGLNVKVSLTITLLRGHTDEREIRQALRELVLAVDGGSYDEIELAVEALKRWAAFVGLDRHGWPRHPSLLDDHTSMQPSR